MALAWLLRQPGMVAPIVGASKMEHLEGAVQAIDVELSDDECRRLEEPYRPHPVLGHSYGVFPPPKSGRVSRPR